MKNLITDDFTDTQKITPPQGGQFMDTVYDSSWVENAVSSEDERISKRSFGTFLNVLYELKKNVKDMLNRKLKELFDSDFITVEDFPETMKILDDIYFDYICEYEKKGYIDLSNSEKFTVDEEEKIQVTFNREINAFLKRSFWKRYLKMILN